jgi:hypothetical protein
VDLITNSLDLVSFMLLTPAIVRVILPAARKFITGLYVVYTATLVLWSSLYGVSAAFELHSAWYFALIFAVTAGSLFMICRYFRTEILPEAVEKGRKASENLAAFGIVFFFISRLVAVYGSAVKAGLLPWPGPTEKRARRYNGIGLFSPRCWLPLCGRERTVSFMDPWAKTLVTSTGERERGLADVCPRSGPGRWRPNQAAGALLLHTASMSGPRKSGRQSIQRQHRGVLQLVLPPTRPMFRNLNRSGNARGARYRRSESKLCRHPPVELGYRDNRHLSARLHLCDAGRHGSDRRKPCPDHLLRLHAVGRNDTVQHVPYRHFPIG